MSLYRYDVITLYRYAVMSLSRYHVISLLRQVNYSDRGSVIVNFVPLPSSLLALMVPWCSATIFCT